MRRCLFEPEHVDFRESASRFVAEEVTPRQAGWEPDGIVDRELFAKAAAKGMLAIQVPEEYGGAGVDDFRFNQIVGEELGVAGAGGSGLGMTLHNDICLPYFLDLGDAEQKQRWLPGIADGSLITAVAMTEPEMGSDLAGLRTTASVTATPTSSTAPRRSSPTGSTPTSSSPPSRPTPPSATPGSPC